MKIMPFLLQVTVAMTSFSIFQATTGSDFTQALVSTDRADDLSDVEDIYSGLIGHWRVRTLDYLTDGNVLEGWGEWHFSRVLEGRAIQDVWIAPPRVRGAKRATHPRSRYGSSLRMLDPTTRQWRVIWINPVSGALDLLDARVENGWIIQEGQRPDGQRIRWIFDSITEHEFHWFSEAEQPDGSWNREAEFFGRRVTA